MLYSVYYSDIARAILRETNWRGGRAAVANDSQHQIAIPMLGASWGVQAGDRPATQTI
jgi:hypothetical protein